MEVNSSCASFSSPPKDNKNNDPQFQLISSKEYERSNNRFNTWLVREVRRLLKRVNPGHHPLVKRQNSIHWQCKELRRNEKNCYLHNTSLQPRASQFSNSDKFILFFSLCLFSKTLTFFVGWKEPLEEFYGIFWLVAVAYQSYFLKSWFSFGIAYGCIIKTDEARRIFVSCSQLRICYKSWSCSIIKCFHHIPFILWSTKLLDD